MSEEKYTEAAVRDKYKKLMEYLAGLGSAAVAFSAGVDSTFLLKAAKDALGDKCIALTGKSDSYPERDFVRSREFCKNEGIRQIVFDPGEMQIEDYLKNAKDRCYYCKHALFSKMLDIAKSEGINYVAEGSNMDDNGDYRPGLKAGSELHILSPLRQAGLYKSEIRVLSKELGLPTWNRPAMACLSSRFQYGERITPEKLHMIETCEEYLSDLGAWQYRVRVHENLARIEVPCEYFNLIMENRESIIEKFETVGFDYVTLDLKGFRSGSGNIGIAH